MNKTTEKHLIDNLHALTTLEHEREKIKAGETFTPDQIKKSLLDQFYINHYNKRIYKFYESLAKDKQIKIDTIKPRSNELIEAVLYMFGYTPDQLKEYKNEAINDAELRIKELKNTVNK
jgi:hypothetical protein